jgi:hypothetical protein
MLGCISFGYLFFVQAKKSNSLRKRKRMLSIKKISIKTHRKDYALSIKVTKLKINLAWILADARMTNRNVRRPNVYFLENEGFVATYDFTPDKIAFTNLSW